MTCYVKESKVCFSNDTLPDGFVTEKGDIVFYMPYAMGRMKGLWGEDAENFRPERWLDANGVFQPESPFKFTAFQVCSKMEYHTLIHQRDSSLNPPQNRI